MQSCPVPPSRRNGLARSFAVRAPVRDTGCTTVALIVRHPCWSWGACAGGGHIPIGVWARTPTGTRYCMNSTHFHRCVGAELTE